MLFHGVGAYLAHGFQILLHDRVEFAEIGKGVASLPGDPLAEEHNGPEGESNEHSIQQEEGRLPAVEHHPQESGNGDHASDGLLKEVVCHAGEHDLDSTGIRHCTADEIPFFTIFKKGDGEFLKFVEDRFANRSGDIDAEDGDNNTVEPHCKTAQQENEWQSRTGKQKHHSGILLTQGFHGRDILKELRKFRPTVGRVENYRKNVFYHHRDAQSTGCRHGYTCQDSQRKENDVRQQEHAHIKEHAAKDYYHDGVPSFPSVSVRRICSS